MRSALFCVIAVLLVACGGGGNGTASQPTTTSRTVRGPADLITEQEINAGPNYGNALEVVRNLRPEMLRPRPGAGSQDVRLYIDNVRMNDMSGLSTVPANRIKEIRFLSARDATTRFGTDHAGGAILLTSKQ